ncbi:hypothetical protein Ancab_003649 [Ancistrocladus abbreviatus]
MEFKSREEEGSLLSSKFNREEPSISAVPCSLEALKGTLTKKKKQQVITLSCRVLHESGVGRIGQSHEDVRGPRPGGKFNNVYSQQFSYSQSGPSGKAHKRASVCRAGGLRAKFLGLRKMFYSRKGSKHSSRVKKRMD